MYIYIWRVGEFNITSTSWVLNLQIEALQRLELPWRHRFCPKMGYTPNCRVYGEIGLKLENSTFQTMRFWGFPCFPNGFLHLLWQTCQHPAWRAWRAELCTLARPCTVKGTSSSATHPAAEPEVWPLQESKPEQERAIHDHTLLYFQNFSKCRTACPHRMERPTLKSKNELCRHGMPWSWHQLKSINPRYSGVFHGKSKLATKLAMPCSLGWSQHRNSASGILPRCPKCPETSAESNLGT